MTNIDDSSVVFGRVLQSTDDGFLFRVLFPSVLSRVGVSHKRCPDSGGYQKELNICCIIFFLNFIILTLFHYFLIKDLFINMLLKFLGTLSFICFTFFLFLAILNSPGNYCENNYDTKQKKDTKNKSKTQIRKSEIPKNLKRKVIM